MLRSARRGLLLPPLLAAIAFGCVHESGGAGDAQLAGWVRGALSDDPRVANDGSVAIDASDGIVTLSGRVPTLASRRYAVLEAQKLLGVRGVIDRLEVAPSRLADREITAEIERRLRAAIVDPEASVAVSTSEGRVWLEGDIATWAEVEEAGLVASEVPGVREVTNRIAAQRDLTIDDEAVRERIEEAFRRDAVLAHLPIRAVVVEGDVGIEGEVTSAHEHHRALRRARSLAPGGVIADRVRVVPHAGPVAAQAEAPEGAQLGEVVKTELALDPRLRGAAIEVSADGRLIVLDGRVQHLGQKRIAEADARNVVGVAWVTNDLMAPDGGRSDAEMRVELAAVFAAIPALRTLSYDVSEGVVTLRGSAPDWSARAQAGVVAGGVEGVREVRNELDTATHREISDGEIVKHIAARLERSAATAHVADRIEVDAHRGVVRLSGDVDTWAQWHAAQRIARRTPGTRAVMNDLGVDPYPFTLEGAAESDAGWLDHDPPYGSQP